MAEILKPETNIAYTLAMKFDDPKIVESTLTGDKQAMITLVDGRIVYAPLFIAEKLGEMGIRKNDPFVLCRREVRTEKGKALRWEVKPAEIHQEIRQEIRQAQPADPGQPATPNAAGQEKITSGSPHQHQPQPTSTTPEPVALKFMAAYKIAVDVLLETRAYAQSKGLALEVRCEDVRTLAATITIDQQRRALA